MPSTIKQVVGSRSALTVTGLSTLAASTYVTSNVYNCSTNQPVDLMAELEVTPGTVSGSKLVQLFAQASYDNSNWQTGPGSGITTTDEAVLTFVGALPTPSNATQQRKSFSVAAAFGGVLPPYLRFVILNSSGAALSAGALYTAEVSQTVG